jgi:hypothetical protein
VSETYRKWGRSVRREGARLVRVDEAGEAEEGNIFRTQPIEEAADLAAPDADAVEAAAAAIEAIVRPPLALERLFVSEANVIHEFEELRWSERLRRVHVAIARPPIRTLIDLADFRFDVIQRIAAALARAGGEREAPKRVRVAGHVGAALLPLLRIEKMQSAAPHDGKGSPIERQRVRGQPPNWFRPSYRLRPRRAWFHLRAESFGEIDGAPEAIALLAPPGEHAIHVLCVDGDRVFPTVIAGRPPLAARATGTWYPYGAGAFGTELML